jgi:hypothetical protein
MEITGQSSLDQMLSFFDCFLKANGYVYDGEVTILEGTEDFFDSRDYWKGKFFNLVNSSD